MKNQNMRSNKKFKDTQ